MPRALLTTVLALALLVPALSAAAGGTKTTGTRGRVVEISAEGSRVAIHAQAPGDFREACEYASVWTPTSGAVVRLPEGKCSQQSERQFDRLTLAGSRLAWADYDYGNHAYCYGPYTATLTRTTPKDLDRCAGEEEGGDYYWEFLGDGSLLVARSYFECAANCEPNYDLTYDADVTIWSVGSSLKKLVAAKDDTKLLAVAGSKILLLEKGGKLVVYSSAGKRGLEIAAGAKAGGLSGSDVVGVSGRTLKVYSATGSLKSTRTLASGAKLQEIDGGEAVYLASGQVRLLRLKDGKDRVAAKAKGLVDAELEPAGLYYAHNSGTGSKPGRVSFVPASALPR